MKKYKHAQSFPLISDIKALEKEYEFDPDTLNDNDTWEHRMTQKYQDELYKEYCLIDLSRYQSGQIGLRWRTKEEVANGKGKQICASLNCSSTSISEFEVNFEYSEKNQTKQTLVKVSLCPSCSVLLNISRNKK